MANEGYNGWTNYETWAWKLWVDNEQGASEAARELAEECYRDAEASQAFTRLERAALDMADRLKENAEENKPDVDGVWADFLNASLGEVNWYEIAKHCVEEIADEVDEDEATEVE